MAREWGCKASTQSYHLYVVSNITLSTSFFERDLTFYFIATDMDHGLESLLTSLSYTTIRAMMWSDWTIRDLDTVRVSEVWLTTARISMRTECSSFTKPDSSTSIIMEFHRPFSPLATVRVEPSLWALLDSFKSVERSSWVDRSLLCQTLEFKRITGPRSTVKNLLKSKSIPPRHVSSLPNNSVTGLSWSLTTRMNCSSRGHTPHVQSASSRDYLMQTTLICQMWIILCMWQWLRETTYSTIMKLRNSTRQSRHLHILRLLKDTILIILS